MCNPPEYLLLATEKGERDGRYVQGLYIRLTPGGVRTLGGVDEQEEECDSRPWT
jgi:hypothetical protein